MKESQTVELDMYLMPFSI